MSLPVGVVLDMDDTLFRERDYVMSGYAAVSRRLALEGLEEDESLRRLQHIFGTGARSRAFDALLGPLGREDLVPAAIDTYRDHTPTIDLTSEACAFLDSLPGDHRVAIVTDGPAGMQRRKVQALGLDAHIPVIVYSDEIAGRASWKPSPLPYLSAAQTLGVDPGDCVYVGDNPHKDFLGARRVGMGAVRYRTGWQLHTACEPEDAAAEPDLEVTDLRSLLG